MTEYFDNGVPNYSVKNAVASRVLTEEEIQKLKEITIPQLYRKELPNEIKTPPEEIKTEKQKNAVNIVNSLDSCLANTTILNIQKGDVLVCRVPYKTPLKRAMKIREDLSEIAKGNGAGVLLIPDEIKNYEKLNDGFLAEMMVEASDKMNEACIITSLLYLKMLLIERRMGLMAFVLIE